MTQRSVVLAALGAAAAVLWACGGPEAGDSCSSGALCADPGTALFCEAGRFRAIPCRGEGGCAVAENQVTCQVQAQANDACAEQHEGGAQCDAANPDNAFKCVGGTWQPQACKGCALQTGSIVCQP